MRLNPSFVENNVKLCLKCSVGQFWTGKNQLRSHVFNISLWGKLKKSQIVIKGVLVVEVFGEVLLNCLFVLASVILIILEIMI